MWAVAEDRTRTARAVADLAGSEPGWAATEGYTSIQQALSAIDRLEVRGRDSAGLHILVHGHGLDVASPAIAGLIGQRADDPLFRSGTVRVVDGSLCLVYKAAAEIGELGDNTRALREAIRSDDLLRLALSHDGRRRRRAGPHPVGLGRHHLPAQRPPGRQHRGDRPGPAPTWWPPSTATSTTSPTSRTPPGSTSPRRSPPTPRSSPRSWPGTWPTATAWSTPSAARWPASRGRWPSAPPPPRSPTACCSPCAAAARRSTSAWPTAPTSWPASPTAWSRSPTATCASTATRRPTPTTPPPAGARSWPSTAARPARSPASSGWPTTARRLPVEESELIAASITTRDIDRGDYPHFLLKEMTEAPDSFRKTLRGKLVERDGRLDVVLPADALPDDGAGRAARRRHPPGAGHRAGDGGGGRRGAGRGPAHRLRVDAAARRGRAGHRAVGLRPGPEDGRHPGDRHQPVGHHHRHQPHGRPGAGPGRLGRGRSSTGGAAT